VTNSCAVAATPLAFGAYSGAQLDVGTSLSVTCTNGAAYTVGLGAGAGAGATVADRIMTGGTGGADTLHYALFSDTGRTANWGETPGTDTVANTGSGIAQTMPVFGRILPGQTSVTAGTYADTVGVTVNF
jgi:spore coat protein U-like protein